MQDYRLAPPLRVAQWFNSNTPVTLEELRGRVVLLHTFQMLCPGCVSHGLPQAQAVHNGFSRDSLVVLGLHTVFEHHAAMNPGALQAFIHEYRLTFPIAVDQPAPSGPVPMTMQAYGFQGTPSLALIDKNGYLRIQKFGRLEDLKLGTMIGQLLSEPMLDEESLAAGGVMVCDEQGCRL
jgi:hypothetical protein